MFLTLLGFIPGVLGLIQKWQEKKVDAHVAITTAQLAGDKEKAIEIVKLEAVAERERTAKLVAVAGSRMLTVLVIIFAAPFALYVWKVVVWDIVLAYGTTDPIRGQVAEWGNTILYFIFGAPTVLTLARMLGRGR